MERIEAIEAKHASRLTGDGRVVVTLRSIGPNPVPLTWDQLFMGLVRNTRPGARGNRATIAFVFLMIATAATRGEPSKFFAGEVEAYYRRCEAGEACSFRELLSHCVQKLDDALAGVDAGEATRCE